MIAGLRRAYVRLRTVPLLGVVATRAVWALKGALGRPVSMPAHSAMMRPPSLAPPLVPEPDRVSRLAFAAIEVLQARVAALLPKPDLPTSFRTEAAGAAPTGVSVVVSTLDRADWLDRALTALLYQRHPAFEIIVVAGPCVDHTDAVLARFAGRIRVARCPLANLSASRNVGLRLAGGDIVAFLDDDAVPEPDWLERLCEPYADPAIGAVGGPIRDHTGVQFQCKVMVADRFGEAREAGTMRGAGVDPPGPQVQRYLSLTGANASFRRRALLDIGGFDEVYAYFLDETDACLRMTEAGWRLAAAPDAEVHHAYAPSAIRRADRAPLSLTACVRSKAHFAVRHALARNGFQAVAQALDAHAEGLRRDTHWRREHGVISVAQARQQLDEIESGLIEGVRTALSTDRPRPIAPAGTSTVRAPAIRPASERLRLCLLSQQYPSDVDGGSPPGGIALWTQALAEAMAAKGHEVTVITRAYDAHATALFEARDGSGLWVHRIAATQAIGSFRREHLLQGLPRSVGDPARAAAAEIARIAPRRGFDLVMGPLWDVEPIAVRAEGRWPVAVSLHTACAQMLAHKPEWSDRYRRTHVDRVVTAERRLLARAPHVLGNSRAAVADIAAALGLPDLAGRTAVIPHGLPDLARGVSAPLPRGDSVRILFVGRLELRKGVDVLLAAAPTILQGAPKAELVIVGEDVAPPGEPATRMAFERLHVGAPWLRRVRFEGAVTRPRLLEHYASCDLVVVPSRYESFGLTALEAMIFSKACVASDVGGLPEVVLANRTGLLVAPGDAVDLAMAVLSLVRDEALRRAMGAAARVRYEANFSAEQMAANYEAWVRSALVGRTLAAE